MFDKRRETSKSSEAEHKSMDFGSNKIFVKQIIYICVFGVSFDFLKVYQGTNFMSQLNPS